MHKSLSNSTRDVRPAPAISSPEESLWKRDLREAIRDPDQLCRELGIESRQNPTEQLKRFPILATRPFISRIRWGDPRDPLLLQVLANADEAVDISGYHEDPVADKAAETAPGLLQKYQGRALLIASGTCAINCRYCFRRHFPYEDSPKGIDAWEPALRQIGADSSINEVILSGGDPLMLVDSALETLLDHLERIPHLSRLRIHTRLPVVIPARVTNRFCRLLKSSRLRSALVFHINHANEIDKEVSVATKRLAGSGCSLLNQSVLLKGVNDSAETLIALSERLFSEGILPYYLHQLDRVRGAAHFATDRGLGEKLIAEMRRQLSGYLVPRYVCEEPGRPHKTVLS